MQNNIVEIVVSCYCKFIKIYIYLFIYLFIYLLGANQKEHSNLMVREVQDQANVNGYTFYIY